MFNKVKVNKKVLVSGVLCNGEPFENIVMEIVDKNDNEILFLDSKSVMHTALLADDKNVVFDNEYCTFVTKVQLKEPTTRLDVIYESKLHDELDKLSVALKKRTIDDSKLAANVYREANEGNKYLSTRYIDKILVNAILMKKLEGYAMQPIEVKFDKLSAPDGGEKEKVLYSPTGIGAVNEEIYFGVKDSFENIPMVSIKTPDDEVINISEVEKEAIHMLPYSKIQNKTHEQIIEMATKKAYKLLGLDRVIVSNKYLLGDYKPELGEEE